jgi:hypothetical protein
MSADKCSPVVVDGEVIRVLGGREMDEADQAALTEIVQAAKRKMAADDALCDHGQCPVCAETVALRKDGTLRAHGGPGILHCCQGSRRPPEPAGDGAP